MRTLLVVTGASKGLGRSFAKHFVRHNNVKNGTMQNSQIGNHLRVLLLARSKEGLLETESIIKEETQKLSSLSPSTSPSPTDSTDVSAFLEVTTHKIDLSDLDSLENELKQIFECALPTTSSATNDTASNQNPTTGSAKREHYDKAILINNAGDIGHRGKTTSIQSLKQMRKDVDLNITSCFWVTTQFIQMFSSKNFDSSASTCNTEMNIINISSLCAIQPFITMGLYCSGKAARDMFHQTLASEYTNSNDSDISEKNDNGLIKVLNYAPGACDTDMLQLLCDDKQVNPEIRESFQKAKDEGSLVNPDDSARKLVDLVMEGKFESGKHIDYWDV